MKALRNIGLAIIMLTALLIISIPCKKCLSSYQSTWQKGVINIPLARSAAALSFLNHRNAASQYYQALAMLYCARLDFPHYHLLNSEQHASCSCGHDHEHHHCKKHNAEGKPYVGFTHGPGGDILLTADDIVELENRARYIENHVSEFMDIEYFYSLIGLSNALDPDNHDILEFGRGWILNRQMAKCMVSELLKANERKPHWRHLFSAGWITLYYLHKPELGRNYLLQASHEKDAPAFVAGIYASSFYADRKYDAAVKQLTNELEATTDHALYTRLEQRRDWYANLALLNKIAREFCGGNPDRIKTLSDLVAAGLIQSIPNDAIGDGFVWDREHAEVVSAGIFQR